MHICSMPNWSIPDPIPLLEYVIFSECFVIQSMLKDARALFTLHRPNELSQYGTGWLINCMCCEPEVPIESENIIHCDILVLFVKII